MELMSEGFVMRNLPCINLEKRTMYELTGDGRAFYNRFILNINLHKVEYV